MIPREMSDEMAEAERYFAEHVDKPPLTETERARAFLAHQAVEEQRPPTREQCIANLSRLSEMITEAVDGATKKRT